MSLFSTDQSTPKGFVGTPARWAQDFSIMAGIAAMVDHGVFLSTGFGLPWFQTVYDLIGTLLTYVGFGALLGAGLCLALEHARDRAPQSVPWGRVLFGSALWGATSLVFARTLFFSLSWDMGGQELTHLAALLAGGAAFGVLLFAPLTLLYTIVSVHRAEWRWSFGVASFLLSLLVANPAHNLIIDIIQG